ncbi:MAG: DUF4445 domain-containing protein, partial [Candidatus Hydrogenedentes bacterium]|nr:DUF4445 domain-containing protein [Candidatus Hydrogenedentota bacterium]
PAVGHSLAVPAAELGLHIHPLGNAFIFPVIGGFVGGDTVSGVLVSRLAEASGPTMLIDIGTNGEIVLANNGTIEAASTAAGPAFEGARITHGMRAAAGAIESVEMNDDVHYRVIGGASPAGICGSALIDIAAGLLRAGILLPQGLMLSGDGLPAGLPAALRDRVIEGEDGLEFVIAAAGESQTGHAITLSQRDVRELQLAVAAIRAGIAILIRRAGLEPAGLDQFLVAGAFGNYVNRDNAQRIGLLPSAVDAARFGFVGNTSLAGARLAAISRGARAQAEELARRARHVDLSLDVNFQTEYVEAMMFPFEE